MLPGNYGGDALANLIAGDANFSGKMPFTYPDVYKRQALPWSHLRYTTTIQ